MATATMGLRRRVQVGNSTSVAQSSSGSGSGGKRTRSDNNNSPSQGNLNSLDTAEPQPKKSRTSARTKAKEMDPSKKVTSSGLPLWTEARNYASIAGLSLGAQQALCSDAVGLSSPIPYIPPTMATFVGTAAGLGKGPSVSYLDISNMTARAPGWPAEAVAGDVKGPLGLPFPPVPLAFAAATATSQSSGSSSSSSTASAPSESGAAGQLPKNFPNDSMFGTYQPWVIKTYGDLAKTKTITIKKYARILRTLRGEEVNSAENSKFRFWVKSKGFHIGQPEGYEAKPADRIIGRHAVTNPGLDPPLYVPTQPPHNKSLNGGEGTVPPGRVYKKVAIVENFFDIIHAVHVDLEGRPGKHAGQKRTYRTITETYAFLPREAVTRFLLGCTECQRRPRTPSPTSLAAGVATPKPGTPTPATDAPASPKPATALSSTASPEATDTAGGDRPREASHPPESKNSSAAEELEPKSTSESAATTTTTVTTTTSIITTTEATSTTTSPTAAAATPITTPPATSPVPTAAAAAPRSSEASKPAKPKEEKYNPLSITNLLRKEPPARRSSPEAPTPASSSSCASPAKPEPTTSSASLPRCLPLDYSLPAGSPYLRQSEHAAVGDQTALEAFRREIEAANATIQAIGAARRERRPPPSGNSDAESNNSESESEAEQPERGFSPAAGLIDTNLNLLATIQQLHCQVMLALTERLRPGPAAPQDAANDS